MRFYLGTHMPHWLTRPAVPLFVSHRRLTKRKTMPKAATSWALDSGGFTELSMFGRWQTTPAEYTEAIERYDTEIGMLDWCAPQDWMCEPFMLAKTGKTVEQHQALTIESYLTLHATQPKTIPVLQGWTISDYHSHIGMYATAGVDLEACDLVGLGSVCRRQATDEIAELVASLHGLRLHGFGVKSEGLRRYGWMLTSADSMSWSARGRRVAPCPHTGVKTCANCWTHALQWRERALDHDDRPVPMTLRFAHPTRSYDTGLLIQRNVLA